MVHFHAFSQGWSIESDYNTDSAMVPIEDLPLQAILEFQPCLASSASCLLQAMAFANGKNITRQDAARIYDTTRQTIPVNLPDIPLHPFTQYPSYPDLRLAINTLEYLSKSYHIPHLPHQHASDTSAASTLPLPDIDTREQLRQVSRLFTHANNMSFTDIALARHIECEEVTLFVYPSLMLSSDTHRTGGADILRTR
jgi:hypothetical protein